MNLNPARAPVMSSMNGMTKLDAGNPNTRYVQNPNGLGIAGGPQNAFTQQMHTNSAQQKVSKWPFRPHDGFLLYCEYE